MCFLGSHQLMHAEWWHVRWLFMINVVELYFPSNQVFQSISDNYLMNVFFLKSQVSCEVRAQSSDLIAKSWVVLKIHQNPNMLLRHIFQALLNFFLWLEKYSPLSGLVATELSIWCIGRYWSNMEYAWQDNDFESAPTIYLLSDLVAYC